MADGTTKNVLHMRTPKGYHAIKGITTKETGLPVSGNISVEPQYVVINMPSYSVIGSTITFDSAVDLGAIEKGDVFVDATMPNPLQFTVEHVIYDLTAGEFKIVLDSTPTNTAAGGAVYRTSVANAMAVYGVNVPGSSGLNVNIRDEEGQVYSFDNPLPVQLSSGSIDLKINARELAVHVDHEDKIIIDYRGGLQSGSSPSTDISISTDDSFLININNEGSQLVTLSNLPNLDNGYKIAAEIQNQVRGLEAISPVNQNAYDNFECTFTGLLYVLKSGSWGANSSVEVFDYVSFNVADDLKLTTATGATGIQIPINETVPGDSIKIGDGTDILAVNSDGSINISSTIHTTPIFYSQEEDISASGFQEIFSYTSTNDNTRALVIESTVGVAATFKIKLNGTEIKRKRSSFSERNVKFEFTEPRNILNGQDLTVEARFDEITASNAFQYFTTFEGFIE